MNDELPPESETVQADLPEASKKPKMVAESSRRERRRLIRSAVASVPVVMTFTAGTAWAQDASKDSALNSEAPQDDELDDSNLDSAPVEEEDETLSPAEELETFGLERIERPEGYDQDPFRDLDSVHPPVDPAP